MQITSAPGEQGMLMKKDLRVAFGREHLCQNAALVGEECRSTFAWLRAAATSDQRFVNLRRAA